MGVATPPGAMAFTKIFAPATSAPTERVKAITAPLVAE